MFRKKTKPNVHFIGIGGIGMSGIAEVLVNLGYVVSGSDQATSYNTDKLKNLGATIFIGHNRNNILDASVVVYSSAVKEDNPELKKAKELGIPTIRRAEMLAEIMRLKYGIAVAGTHGKTTTTSFLATILFEAKVDPTHVIGGIVENLGGHARLGKSEFIVVEADESDGSFLLLDPILSVITNIDDDHLDFYKTEANLLKAFTEFANKVPFYGAIIYNYHDKKIDSIRPSFVRPSRSFGIHEDGARISDANYVAKNVVYEKHKTSFDLYYNGELQTKMVINLVGKHNVLNALGAIAAAHILEVDFDVIAKGILKFKGAGRRFQELYADKFLEIIDDYGHHPTEVRTTLHAAKATRPDSKLVVVFEPHRYSRTEYCWKDFLHCFNEADVVYIAPIYAASEAVIEGINHTRLVQDINNLHAGLAHTLPDLNSLEDVYKKYQNEKTTLIVLGAGSISKKGKEAVARFKAK